MREVLCVILGGGRGSRLYPLTKERSKPAVAFAAKYRLIDIPISNSLNSGCNHIYVLTQFNSESLNKHIARTYQLDRFSQGFVEIMAAEQSRENSGWFQGSADAVRRSLKHFNYPGIKYILVLSGDQLYKMDFRQTLNFHIDKKSEITIACSPVSPKQISDFGIICLDHNGRINSFVEKPQSEENIKSLSVKIDRQTVYLASMGIYLFNKDTLIEVLSNNQKTDFGREVIPDSFSHKLTYAYIHRGYWRDIGTISSLYEESLIFTDPLPPLNLFDEKWQIFTRPRYLPPAKIEDCCLDKVIVGDGSILINCRIKHSVIGLRSRVQESVQIEDSILMGNDFYQSSIERKEDHKSKIPPIGIARNSIIRKAIIDKNVRIGEGVKIINQKNTPEAETNLYSIKDGIVIIPKNTIIPSGTVI